MNTLVSTSVCRSNIGVCYAYSSSTALSTLIRNNRSLVDVDDHDHDATIRSSNTKYNSSSSYSTFTINNNNVYDNYNCEARQLLLPASAVAVGMRRRNFSSSTDHDTVSNNISGTTSPPDESDAASIMRTGETDHKDKDQDHEESQSPQQQHDVQLQHDVHSKIAERLLWFFSDTNLQWDNFMRREMEAHPDGQFLNLESLMTFPTIQQIVMNNNGNDGTDLESEFPSFIVVQETLKALPVLQSLLKLNAAQDAIGRVVEFEFGTTRKNNNNHNRHKHNKHNTIILKGLPINRDDKDNHAYTHSVEDIRQAFSMYGDILFVRRLLEHDTGLPKGEAHVEFQDQRMAQDALEDLTSTAGSDVDANDDIVKKQSSATPATIMLNGNEVTVESMAAIVGGANQKQRRHHRNNYVWTPGCVLYIRGLPQDEFNREDLQEAIMLELEGEGELEEFQGRIFYDYERGDTEGALRFPFASPTLQTLATKLQSAEVELVGKGQPHAVQLSAIVLEGNEEDSYYQHLKPYKVKRMQQRNGFASLWQPGCVICVQGLPSASAAADSAPSLCCDRETIAQALDDALLSVSLEHAHEHGYDTTTNRQQQPQNNKQQQSQKQSQSQHKSQSLYYIDYARGQTKAFVRFAEPLLTSTSSSSSGSVVQRLTDKLQETIMSMTTEEDQDLEDLYLLSAAILEGDEERTYWNKVAAKAKQQQQQRMNMKRTTQSQQQGQRQYGTSAGENREGGHAEAS
jgi:RNA recognition motif-containing protein